MFDASHDTQHDAAFNPFMVRPKTVAEPSLLVRLWGAAAKLVAALDRRRKVWLTVDRLRRLDDRTLRDIGVERDQIETVIRDQSVRW
ncbi:MAG: DUF1127 domain-containing protein [Paracoccaceae bacterium]|nr:DUF1127 domain-containing protein [Paracoccaceae bacterium]